MSKQLENLTGAVIFNQLALNYNETLKYTKFYKHESKKVLNLSITELTKIEKKGIAVFGRNLEIPAIVVCGGGKAFIIIMETKCKMGGDTKNPPPKTYRII